MSTIHKTMAVASLLAAMVVALSAGGLRAADEEPNDELVQMITELVSDTDRDMRALGLQQVREEVPGAAATKKFAELLPKLSPEAQAGLLEALGDRHDAAALPAVLKAIDSDQEVVRAAALGALGSLGGKDRVVLLADKAASGSEPEKAAARQSLIRLRGDGVNEAIEAAMDGAKPAVRTALLDALAARNARQSLSAVFDCAKDSDPTVRSAALRAIRYLADDKDTAKVVALVKKASDDSERRAAELALLTICSRGREACAEAVAAGLADADVPSRVVLVDVLARAGGPKALEAITARLDDKDPAVRTEAVRMLSSWPTDAAVATLKKLAASHDQRDRVLALRGLVRLASSADDKPADVAMLGDAMKLADRPDEKRLVLGALGSAATTDALDQAVQALDDPQVADDAALAVVLIAKKMDDKAKAKDALQKASKAAKDESVRQQAQEALKSL